MAKQREPKLPTGLSPSSMELYHQCPRRYEEEKVKGGYSPPGVEAVLGTFVHRVLELVMQRFPEERTLEKAREAAKVAWDETIEKWDFKNLRLNEMAKKKFKRDAWLSIENYFAMENPQAVEVVATEGMVKCEIEGVTLRGIIDRLDREQDGLVVSDYKNGKVGDVKYHGPKRDQLNIYALMVEATEEERPKRGRLIFTAHSEFITVDFTDSSLSEVKEKITTTWSNINRDYENENFKATPGPLCGWCPFLAKCPEGMGHATMLFRRGRLKPTAPGYAVVIKNARGT